jgi:anti-sigma factor RsiW
MISRLVDGELAGEDRRLLDEHMSGCGACRDELAALAAGRAALAGATAPAQPPYLLSRVMAEVRRSGARSRRWFALGRAASAVAAALLVVAGAGVGVFFGTSMAQAGSITNGNGDELLVGQAESVVFDVYESAMGGEQ